MTFENFMAECGNKVKLFVDKSSPETDPEVIKKTALKYVYDFFEAFNKDQKKLNKLNAEQLANKNAEIFNLQEHYATLKENYDLAFEFFAEYCNANKIANNDLVHTNESMFENFCKWITTKDVEEYDNEL